MKFTQLTSSNYLFLAGFLVILTCSTCCAAAARNFTTAEKAALIKVITNNVMTERMFL